MKNTYLDLMELALSAYDEQRIADYIQSVKEDGLKEHGFPRLGANIGILLVYSRRPELKDTFVQIMDLCCAQMPLAEKAHDHFGNDFTVREICRCLILLESTDLFPKDQLTAWKESFRNFDPRLRYDEVAPTPETPKTNWALFAAVSEFVRSKYLGADSAEFIDTQIASQLLAIDENGMYKDPHCPMVYDCVARTLFSVLLGFGYDGKHKAAIEQLLDKSARLTLQLQSVTGELPFGGRSNQFVHNEAMLVALYEAEATRFAVRGDLKTAGRFKAAAALAVQQMLQHLKKPYIYHIKNKYPRDSGWGCEGYGYFNKYMITVASNVYMALLFCDEHIPAVPPESNYVAQTSADFHKVALRNGTYFLEFDTNADTRYDGSGLGRVHKQNCDSRICLCVPFPVSPSSYRLEQPNPTPMSLCSFDGEGIGATGQYRYLGSRVLPDSVEAEFLSEATAVTEHYCVTQKSVTVTLSGGEAPGFMLPVWDFDGQDHTKVTVEKNSLTVAHEGSTCIYRFSGSLAPVYQTYCNRNGRYRVYRLHSRNLEIEIV